MLNVDSLNCVQRHVNMIYRKRCFSCRCLNCDVCRRVTIAQTQTQIIYTLTANLLINYYLAFLPNSILYNFGRLPLHNIRATEHIIEAWMHYAHTRATPYVCCVGYPHITMNWNLLTLKRNSKVNDKIVTCLAANEMSSSFFQWRDMTLDALHCARYFSVIIIP